MTEITCPCCGHPMLLPFKNGAGHTCYMVGCDGCGFGGETVRVELEDAQLDAKRLVRGELARLVNDRVLHGTWYRESDELPRKYSILDATRAVLGEYAWRADNPLRLPGEPE